MRRTMTQKLTIASAIAGLALFGAACDDGDDVDDVGEEIEQGVDEGADEVEEGVDEVEEEVDEGDDG